MKREYLRKGSTMGNRAFSMSQQMQVDAELAGNSVVYSSALACFTIFGWVFLFKTLELF